MLAVQAKGVLPAGCYAASVTWSALQKTNPIRARHMTLRAVPAARHPQQTSTIPAAEAPRDERANHFFSLLRGPDGDAQQLTQARAESMPRAARHRGPDLSHAIIRALSVA